MRLARQCIQPSVNHNHMARVYSIAYSFYHFIVVRISFYRSRHIVLSLRFIVVGVNLEMVLTVHPLSLK